MHRLTAGALLVTSVLLGGTVAPAAASAAPGKVLVESYVVAALNHDLAMSVEDHSSEDREFAELAPLAHLPRQRWELGENDITYLQNLSTEKCLQFAFDADLPHNPVVQAECDHSDRQTWYYVAADDHFSTWRFENVATGTCITAPDIEPGTRLVEAACDEDDARQAWTSIDAEA